MNEPSLKNTFSLSPISSAPRRPQKLGSVQSIVRDDAARNVPSPFEEIVLSDDEEEKPIETVKCQLCSRDMTNWMNSRRDIHTKVCKAKRAEQEKEKEKSTIRKSKTLTETIEKDDQVLEKPSKVPLDTYKSWEVSKNNVKFARIAADDEENRKRKRPRSFAVVELAPKKCQCEVLTTLHSRFIDEFHCKSLENKKRKEEGVTEHSFQMKKILGKLSRYEQLSSDMQKTLDDTSDILYPVISISSSDGHNVKCHSIILKNRTSMLRMHPKSENIEISQTREVMKAWLTFVYTANIEWNQNERSGIKELAVKYGPVGLEKLVKEETPEVEEKSESHASVADPEDVIVEDEPVAKTIADTEEVIFQKENTIADITVINEEPVNYFSTDNPFIGFGQIVGTENAEDTEDNEIIIESVSNTTISSIQKRSGDNVTMDSFDEWSNQPINDPSTSSSINVVTPVRNSSKPIFGSHIKVLKTNNVTPMPQFDTMDENELKERMHEIGMRPKGKKAMIQTLKKAYTTLHPEVCTGTPTIRPLIIDESAEKNIRNVGKASKSGKSGVQKAKTLSERMADSPKKVPTKHPSLTNISHDSGDADVDNEADKTLNMSNDEREVGKICGDDIGEEEEDDDVATSSTSGKPDLNSLRVSFLNWLRDEPNSVLYEHILSLQPVSLEEMLVRLEKAEGPLGRIGKGKLVKVLEMLRITYQLPQKTGRARVGGFKRRL